MNTAIIDKTVDAVAKTLYEKYNIHLQKATFGDENECVLQYMDSKWNAVVFITENISMKNLPFWVEKTNNNHKFILIANYINEKIGGILKDKNIQYADSIGNVYLEEMNNALNLFIYRNDFKTINPRQIDNKLPDKLNIHNIFTQKGGLQVLFALLCDKNLITSGVRQLAVAANVGFGTAQKYKKALQQQQYLVETKQGWQLHKRKKLIERWLIGYQEILKPIYEIGRFEALSKDWKNDLLAQNLLWSGEPAAELLATNLEPYHFDIYMNDKVEDFLFKPNNKGDITLLKRFWGDLSADESSIVPILLVYADLMCSKSARNHEIAQQIYEKYGFE